MAAFSAHPTGRLGVRPDCKPCRAAYNREWKAVNREKHLESARRSDAKWYAKNSETKRAASKRWKAENPDRYRATYEKHNEARAEAWAEDPERFRAIRRAQYAANPEPAKALAARRKALLLGVYVEDVPFDEILQRDLGICGICGQQVMENTVELDHVLPLAAGGLHERRNVQIAHRACNRKKHAKVGFTIAA